MPARRVLGSRLANINDTRVQFTSYNSVKAGLGMTPNGVFMRTITPADLTDADTSQDVDVATDDAGNAFPTNAKVMGGAVLVTEAFTGPSITELTISLGDVAAATELLPATSAFTASGYARGLPVDQPEAAYAPIARCDSTGANVGDITTGRAVVFVYYWAPENPLAAAS